MRSEEEVPVAEELIDNLDQGRFELHRDRDLVGWLCYTHLRPNRYALRHAEVEASHQHQGVASAMVRRVLDEIRVREGTITAIGPFVVDYLSRTTTYAGLIDTLHYPPARSRRWRPGHPPAGSRSSYSKRADQSTSGIQSLTAARRSVCPGIAAASFVGQARPSYINSSVDDIVH